MNEETKYNFSHICEIIQEIHSLYEPEEQPTEEQKRPLRQAINDFFRTRTVSEMIDTYDWSSDEINSLSIFDFEDWLLKPFEKEMESRSLWIPQDLVDVYNILLPEWAGKDNLKTRVDGIQKKLDKIVSLLEKFKVEMSVKDALNL